MAGKAVCLILFASVFLTCNCQDNQWRTVSAWIMPPEAPPKANGQFCKYREVGGGDSDWIYVPFRPNFRLQLNGLKPGTQYEARVDYTDSEGRKMETESRLFKTRGSPPPPEEKSGGDATTSPQQESQTNHSPSPQESQNETSAATTALISTMFSLSMALQLLL